MHDSLSQTNTSISMTCFIPKVLMYTTQKYSGQQAYPPSCSLPSCHSHIHSPGHARMHAQACVSKLALVRGHEGVHSDCLQATYGNHADGPLPCSTCFGVQETQLWLSLDCCSESQWALTFLPGSCQLEAYPDPPPYLLDEPYLDRSWRPAARGLKKGLFSSSNIL